MMTFSTFLSTFSANASCGTVSDVIAHLENSNSDKDREYNVDSDSDSGSSSGAV